ncbi:MAG TPA: hypothetical protein PLZ57_06155 [Pseudobdellovibrionaceae bacterium]|nr:hypothetical protein [Pseudobdellovibrionaceae bacterium]
MKTSKPKRNSSAGRVPAKGDGSVVEVGTVPVNSSAPLKLAPNGFENLLNSSDEMAFLRFYLEVGRAQGESASALAARAGFKSSGHISDLLAHRRQLTLKSLDRLARSLRLPELYQQYFVVLARRSKPEQLAEGQAVSVVEAEHRRLRSRLREDLDGPRKEEEGQQIVSSLATFVLFAALEPNRGLTLAELRDRSGLSHEVLQAELSKLMQLKLTYEFDGKIFCQQERFQFMGESFSRSFKACFVEAGELMLKRARVMEEHPTDLFMYTSFLVPRNIRRSLQGKIQSLILAELDREQPDSGDEVAHLIFSVMTARPPDNGSKES